MTEKSRSLITAGHGEQSPAWFEPCLHSAYFLISAKHISGQPRAITGQPRLLPIVDFLPLLEAAGAAEMPERGIGMGLAIPLAAHGLVGLCASASDTLWHAMETMARYTPVRNTMFECQSYQDGEIAVVEFRPRLQLGEFEKFFGYVTVMAVYNILRAISEEAATNTFRLTFPWEKPAEPQASTLPAAIYEFETQFLSIRVPLNIAMQHSQSAEPDLFDRLKLAVEQELTTSIGSTAARVRQVLRRNPAEWPSLQAVANDIGMSKRTIIRKLESEQLSYQILLDEARCELACWFLRRPDMRMSEIAEQVGFSDQAGFARSFRRVQGRSPSRYRSDLRIALSAI